MWYTFLYTNYPPFNIWFQPPQAIVNETHKAQLDPISMRLWLFIGHTCLDRRPGQRDFLHDIAEAFHSTPLWCEIASRGSICITFTCTMKLIMSCMYARGLCYKISVCKSCLIFVMALGRQRNVLGELPQSVTTENVEFGDVLSLLVPNMIFVIIP